MRKENWSHFHVILHNFHLFISILIKFIICVSSKTLRGRFSLINESNARFEFPSNFKYSTSANNLSPDNSFTNLNLQEQYSCPNKAVMDLVCYQGTSIFSYFSLVPISHSNDLEDPKLIRHLYY